ncbi:DNA polymerase III subunit alpha [Candidatus Walczuchella monophlebidarum]|uniref:DNA polymerase III subunit alpha n=1 Tax=Candidatus Walczuchella monophlebidarum TaxID=1415657 RepID=A0A068DSN9_9FLAO|nr:DNA polymerase III subunit alpha [Candidatus Walczuchella monophlebidarum]AID37404.1 putative DNA polymerase III, alpha subunit (dnaE)/DNA polymerase III, epsilon subunit (dnaQ) fusion protein [Candidatus Walczuchella monophlebidarum]
MYLIFDTETNGLPENYDTEKSPRMVQLAWQLYDETFERIEVKNFIVKSEGFDIPFNSVKIHGITAERSLREGYPLQDVLICFKKALEKSQFLIGHNIAFDINVVSCEFFRKNYPNLFLQKTVLDTKDESINYCAFKGRGRGKKFKWPTLTELYYKLFGTNFPQAHNAAADVEATVHCFVELLRLGVISVDKLGIDQFRVKKFIQKVKSLKISPIGQNVCTEFRQRKVHPVEKPAQINNLRAKFAQIHNHTTFSILSATTDVSSLVKRAFQWGMPAVGITDYGNLMGSFSFLKEIEKANAQIDQKSKTLKGIIGCEIFMSENDIKKKITKDHPDIRYKQVFLAKNKNGYQNLSKLCSEGYINGQYAPRVGKELILQYKEGLITFTGYLDSEIPSTILNQGEIQGEEIFKWWHNTFKDDFYVELFRHGLEEEDYVNEVLLRFSEKYNVKYIPQNNSFYLDREDANAHDILLCVRDREKKSTPIGSGRGYRFGFRNQEFYFKSASQMIENFSDFPKSFDYLEELINKISHYSLEREVILPHFEITKVAYEGQRGENAYLSYLAYQGAEKRYGKLSKRLRERLEFELNTIERTRYPGYFLIVQDIVAQAKKMGISVGPGRGSGAGSLVAYCIGLTQIDPIRYNLLFERFLNPDRISMPDIDIDFDDRGRDRIIAWIVKKYGRKQVAKIITYSRMGAKSAIRDSARVLDLPLAEADRLAKMMPNLSLKELFSSTQIQEKIHVFDLENALKIKQISQEQNLEGKVLRQASVIEGSLRNIGVHACGIIITPSDITNYIPVAISKDSDLLITQFDNNWVENAGLLKIDILGLKTLTIIKDSIKLIETRHGLILNPNQFPLDDPKTSKLFQRGDTVAVFQYESYGMKSYIRKLNPDNFDDLIAINALYRPGPLQYIPNFIARKHGKESITYSFPEMEEFLSSTYGITIYQEQVMLLAQKLAGFGKGEADVLRKAMGKKQKPVLDQMKSKFIEGAVQKGYTKKILEKIWTDWESFASYAFNKSHSTCYANLAFQTAYLKAHYPSEYMAAVLSNNMHNLKEIIFLMEECRRLGVLVLCPDINESYYTFSVNEKGAIRFGMGAIKGIREASIEAILQEREKKGIYRSIFDLVKRVDFRIVNKKTLESLVLSGAFDSFSNVHRAQYFDKKKNCFTALEKIIRFGEKYQNSKQKNQCSLFQEEPVLPYCTPWPNLIKLLKEKEVIGIYISSHPLYDYRQEILAIEGIPLQEFNRNEYKWRGKEVNLYGIILRFEKKISVKNNSRYGVFTLEDYQGTREFRIFGAYYTKYAYLLVPNTLIHLKIILSNFKILSNFQKFRVSFLNIQLLDNVLNSTDKDLYLKIDLERLDNEMINNIEQTISKYKGSRKLKVILLYHQGKRYMGMLSRSYGVSIERGLVSDLEQIPNISLNLS